MSNLLENKKQSPLSKLNEKITWNMRFMNCLHAKGNRQIIYAKEQFEL